MANHKLPTKEQKFKIYTLALELYRNNLNGGMCLYITKAQMRLRMRIRTPYSDLKPKFPLKEVEDFELNFPEIFAYKPKRRSVYEFWWDTYTEYGQRKRIKILKAAIEATKPINSNL
jgi:hypothetical protein